MFVSEVHILKISTLSKQVREGKNLTERHPLQFQPSDGSCNQSKQCIGTKEGLSCHLLVSLKTGSSSCGQAAFLLCVPMIVFVKPIVMTSSRCPEEEM